MVYPSEELLEDRNYWAEADTTRADVGEFLRGFYGEDPTTAELRLTAHALSVSINDPERFRIGNRHPKTDPSPFGIKYHPDSRTSINPFDHVTPSEKDYLYITSGTISIDPVRIEMQPEEDHLDAPTEAFNRTFAGGARDLPIDVLNLFRRGDIFFARMKILPVFER